MDDCIRFTDPAAIKALLAERLPLLYPGGHAITNCRVQHVRYHPKKNPEKTSVAGCWHLDIKNSDPGHERSLILYFKAFRNGRSQIEIDAITGPIRPIHFRDLDLLLWVFPDDPALPHLPTVSEPERVIAHLPYASLPNGLDGAENIQAVEVKVVNYRPELRCTTRYDLSWGPADQPQLLTLFGKTFGSGEGKDIYARSEYLWNRYSEIDDKVLFSQPLGYSSEIQTLWQLGIEGTPLCRVIEENSCDSYMRTVAKGLAMVHTSELAGLPTWTQGAYLAEVDKKIEKLQRAVPTLAQVLNRLAQLVHRHAPNPSDIPFRPMYWDFHVEQLLAQEGKVAFFDFDELAIGDPLQDIANFIVDLQFRDVESSLARQIAKSLYDSYRSQVMWEVPIDRVRWHARVQFLNKAYRVYIQQPPNVQETVQKIVHMAAQDTIFGWIDDAKLIEGMSR